MKLTYRIHAWVGLITGVFLLVICVTGSLAVFKPEIDRAFEPEMKITVDPDGPRANLDDIWQRVEQQCKGTVTAVWLPAKPSSMFTHGNAISLWLTKVKRPNPTEVLVHPNTGEIVYARRRLDSWGQWLRELHKALLYGYWGRVFVGAFGVTLALSTVLGLIIFPRFNRGRWTPSIRWDRGSRILLADLHKASGLITAVLSLVIAVSGAVVGLENLYHRYGPDDDDDKPRFVMPDRGPFMDGILEHSVAKAREAMPHAFPSRVIVPRGKRTVAIVTMEHPDHKLIKENASFVRFNAITGNMIDMRDATAASAGTRLYYSMEPLHFGRLWGSLTVKLLYGAVGIVIGFLCVSGYIIYVTRKVTAFRSRRARRAAATAQSTDTLIART